MKLNAYCIYDTATAAYMRPVFMQSDGQAIRTFIDIATSADSDIGKHPEDYSLVRIGIWWDSTRYDMYYPVLAHLGEQAVLSGELYYDGTANDNDVFGYQERYAHYRYKPSRLTALMRVNATGTLAAWHLSENFSTRPTLGATFITANTGTPLDRAVAVPSQPHVIADFYFNLQCARPMPLYGVPGMLDHF